MKLLVHGIVLLVISRVPTPINAAVSQRLQLRQVGSEARRERRSNAGDSVASTRLRYVLRLLDEFKAYAVANGDVVETTHVQEALRLKAALNATQDEGVRLALQQSVTSNEQSLIETERIYDNLANFTGSLHSLLTVADKKGIRCQDMICGKDASCTDTTHGAECVCHEGYIGNGQDCFAPPDFRPHRLIVEGSTGLATVASEIHVGVFEAGKIAVVFVDVARARLGRVVVGTVTEAGLATFSAPEQFTESDNDAFNPVVHGSAYKRILIGWRDKSRGGVGWIRGARMGDARIRGADMALVWGQPISVAQNQGHKMAVTGVGGNRFVVMYSDSVAASSGTPAESFGNSIFVEVGPHGGAMIVGNFRFSDYPVCRLEVTKVSQTAFIVAARSAPQIDDDDTDGTSSPVMQEAIAIYGEALGDDLVFDPNPVNMEPKDKQIWARGVSLIAPYTFAYAYQEGEGPKIKIGVVEIDPRTHHMKVVQQPLLIHAGFSPYVSMLSVPYTASDPHTLTYYMSGNMSMINICSWQMQSKTLAKCEDFPWLFGPIPDAAGVHLSGGKTFMAFASEDGTPWYTVFGLSKK